MNRGLSKESAMGNQSFSHNIEIKMKEKRMADAEAMQKENGGDTYNMKVTLIIVTFQWGK